jgi:hypothetical protein
MTLELTPRDQLSCGSNGFASPVSALMASAGKSPNTQLEFGWAVKYEVGPEQNNLRRSKKQ